MLLKFFPFEKDKKKPGKEQKLAKIGLRRAKEHSVTKTSENIFLIVYLKQKILWSFFGSYSRSLLKIAVLWQVKYCFTAVFHVILIDCDFVADRRFVFAPDFAPVIAPDFALAFVVVDLKTCVWWTSLQKWVLYGYII